MCNRRPKLYSTQRPDNRILQPGFQDTVVPDLSCRRPNARDTSKISEGKLPAAYPGTASKRSASTTCALGMTCLPRRKCWPASYYFFLAKSGHVMSTWSRHDELIPKHLTPSSKRNHQINLVYRQESKLSIEACYMPNANF